MVVGEKSGCVAARLRSCQDLPSPLEYVTREKVATWPRSYAVVKTTPPPQNMIKCPHPGKLPDYYNYYCNLFHDIHQITVLTFQQIVLLKLCM